jgi:hypothetical protein
MDKVDFPPILRLYRFDYSSRKEYAKAYQAACQHYGKGNKIRVLRAGWWFYESEKILNAYEIFFNESATNLEEIHDTMESI